jgi:hypothetical protein
VPLIIGSCRTLWEQDYEIDHAICLYQPLIPNLMSSVGFLSYSPYPHEILLVILKTLPVFIRRCDNNNIAALWTFIETLKSAITTFVTQFSSLSSEKVRHGLQLIEQLREVRFCLLFTWLVKDLPEDFKQLDWNSDQVWREIFEKSFDQINFEGFPNLESSCHEDISYVNQYVQDFQVNDDIHVLRGVLLTMVRSEDRMSCSSVVLKKKMCFRK